MKETKTIFFPSSSQQIVAKESGTICSTDFVFTVKCQQEYKYEHWQILLEINFQQTVLFKSIDPINSGVLSV